MIGLKNWTYRKININSPLAVTGSWKLVSALFTIFYFEMLFGDEKSEENDAPSVTGISEVLTEEQSNKYREKEWHMNEEKSTLQNESFLL